MTCKSCVDKWTDYYRHKGLSQKKAVKMAKNLVKRVEKRLERENKPYEPMYLIEKAGEGIILIHKKVKHQNRLYQWCFLTQWRATIWQSFKHHMLIWIGRGNPVDYTQACNACPAGDCSPGENCGVVGDCRYCPPTTCPAPSDPNSHAESNTCSCVGTGGCLCSSKICKASGTLICSLSGICNYHCNTGYTWNGVACVPVAGVAEERFDGYYFLDPA